MEEEMKLLRKEIRFQTICIVFQAMVALFILWIILESR